MVSTESSPRILRTPAEAAAVLDPLRLRLLRNLEFPISAAGLARRLHLPRQKVNYHLRELEKAGLVRLARERRVGNCTERLVQATGRRFVLSPEILGGLSPEPGTLPETTVSAAVSFASEEARAAFVGALRAELDRLVGKHGAPNPAGGSDWHVVIGLHAEKYRRRLPDPG